MRNRLTLLLVLLLTSCTTTPSQIPSTGLSSSSPTPKTIMPTAYPDLGPAPELAGDVWINSSPLHLSDLRGKVILLDMWTFECINCIHTVPSLIGWYDKYSPQGLVIIGNHFPEFAYERDFGNLKQAVLDLKIPYPVVQDNDGVNWNAYHNAYWPTFYLIDKQGRIRYTHIGEGAYPETEKAIQALLSES